MATPRGSTDTRKLSLSREIGDKAIGKLTVPEEEEIDFYGKEDGDDEYGDDYGEEGDEEGGEDYGEEDYGEEEEEVAWPPPALITPDPLEDRYFKAGETMRG